MKRSVFRQPRRTVWLVMHYDYDATDFVGVYASRERAMAAHPGDWVGPHPQDGSYFLAPYLDLSEVEVR